MTVAVGLRVSKALDHKSTFLYEPRTCQTNGKELEEDFDQNRS